MDDFRVNIRGPFMIQDHVTEGDAATIRDATPPGWHPVLEAFLADPDVTEMVVNSASMGMSLTFQRQPGAVAR